MIADGLEVAVIRRLPFPDPILVLRGVKDVGWLAHGVGIYFPVLVSVMALGVLLGRRLTWARKRALSTDEWPTLLYTILVPRLHGIPTTLRAACHPSHGLDRAR
jgi:hypothetical protein